MLRDTKGDGIIYISESGKHYYLCEGIASNGLKTGIIFIMEYTKRPCGDFVNFFYGDFESLEVECVKSYVEDYEKEEN